MLKTCNYCDTEKDVTEFNRDSNQPDGYKARCAACVNEIKRSRYSPEKRREEHLQRCYNLTISEYDALLQLQGGGCAICGDTTALHVDHNHDTNEVRAILCGLCNTALGRFRDNPELLHKAVDYLNQYGNYS